VSDAHEGPDPPRWTEPGSDGPDGLGDLFRSARADVPADRLARVLARLPGGGGGGTGGSAPSPPRGGAPPAPSPATGALPAIAFGAVIAGTIVAIVVGSGAMRASTPVDARQPAASDALPVEPSLSSETEAEPEPDTTTVPGTTSPRPAGAEEVARAPRRAARREPETSDERASAAHEELEHLIAVRAAVRAGDASAALSALARYDRAFPGGVLSEEAEALRIEALLIAGRRADADRALARFRREHSGSAHLRRLDRLIAPAVP
jgi:hypothetical protein